MTPKLHPGALIASGTLVGAGLGGFVDGILFHQILQWHNMLSSRVAPVTLVAMKYNMLWDGLFHAFAWLMTVIGLAMLWRWQERLRTTGSNRTLAGALALGWGLFNVIEGLINHHILAIHHVHPGSYELAWDIAFLLVGGALVAAGSQLIRAGRRESSSAGGLNWRSGSAVGP
jgi:uncharacterized membrane protein